MTSTIITKIEQSKATIADAVREFYPNIALAVSLGKDSMVALSLLQAIDPRVKLFIIMTRFKPPESFKFYDYIKKLWDLDIKLYMSSATVPDNFPSADPDECCRLLKVIPTKRAIREMELVAWMTGLRRTEGRTRTDYKIVEISELELDDGTEKTIIKINPILDWTETDIWKYIAFYDVPIHPWYRLGFRSLGCEPCTNMINDEESERAGRWQGTSKCGGECGVHTMGRRMSAIKTNQA